MTRRYSIFPAALALALSAAPASANGRLPGATALLMSNGGQNLVARATFGFVHSSNGGKSWQWICEAAIRVSGEADPPMSVTADGTIVLLPPAGGAIISRDSGCTWAGAGAPLAGLRTSDVTLDPSDPTRAVIVASTVATIDDEGIATYTNELIEGSSNAASWQKFSVLPGNFRAETLEVAPSDPSRIYVSGTDTKDPLLGVLFHSADRGKTWARRTLALPENSGSFFISGIHPSDPNRVWLRVPALNDTFGAAPASLVTTSDRGEHFETLARTDTGMFGFALSPDGSELAYGGPFNGLYVGPSDGSGAFARKSDIGVRCLKWTAEGLYACGSEPRDRFSVGRSSDRGTTFEPVYRIAATCPAECRNATDYETACRGPWQTIGAAIGADESSCTVDWFDWLKDAGVDTGPPPADGGASAPAETDADDDCGCHLVGSSRHGGSIALAGVLGIIAFRRRVRLRRAAPRESGVRRRSTPR